MPALTGEAIRSLGPQGSAATAGRQVFVIGAAAAPEGYETLAVEGGDPAELAAEVARLRERLAGKPEHMVLASSDEPAYAMPAAGWAARSGDPVLFIAARRAARSRRSRRCAAMTASPCTCSGRSRRSATRR